MIGLKPDDVHLNEHDFVVEQLSRCFRGAVTGFPTEMRAAFYRTSRFSQMSTGDDPSIGGIQ